MATRDYTQNKTHPSKNIKREFLRMTGPYDKSRYKQKHVVLTKNTLVKLPLNIEDLQIQESDEDRTHIVTIRDEYRIDMIAQRYYGDRTLYWLIAQANNLRSTFFIPRGTKLRIPPREFAFERRDT